MPCSFPLNGLLINSLKVSVLIKAHQYLIRKISCWEFHDMPNLRIYGRKLFAMVSTSKFYVLFAELCACSWCRWVHGAGYGRISRLLSHDCLHFTCPAHSTFSFQRYEFMFLTSKFDVCYETRNNAYNLAYLLPKWSILGWETGTHLISIMSAFVTKLLFCNQASVYFAIL